MSVAPANSRGVFGVDMLIGRMRPELRADLIDIDRLSESLRKNATGGSSKYSLISSGGIVGAFEGVTRTPSGSVEMESIAAATARARALDMVDDARGSDGDAAFWPEISKDEERPREGATLSAAASVRIGAMSVCAPRPVNDETTGVTIEDSSETACDAGGGTVKEAGFSETGFSETGFSGSAVGCTGAGWGGS